MTKIIDKIHARRKKRNATSGTSKKTAATTTTPPPASWYYSFEFFPPKTEAGLENLQVRIDRMVQRLSPLFIDVTWGASGSTAEKTLTLSSYAQKYCGVDVLMHLTCQGMTKRDLRVALERAKGCGVENILALRGDPPVGGGGNASSSSSGGLRRVGNGVSGDDEECEHAIDLVALIREWYGDYFGIGVAGHPEGHALSKDPDEEMRYLKEKVDVGADFILTQFFYDTSLFIDYVKRCRKHGITCPIIPGIMPIPNYSSFCVMTEVCGTKVPPEITARIEPVKGDDEAVKDIGCEIAVDMCQEILSCDEIDVDGVHFYTLNLERSVGRIVDEMRAEKGGRQFPWRTSAIQKRLDTECVRPINWANRPKSYVLRTDDWDEFPNGRWGDSTSPAFGELINLAQYYYPKNTYDYDEQLRASLGDHPVSISDIRTVFANYVLGKVPHLPWCETNNLQPETSTIQRILAKINHLGFLTINSQPPVNGVASNDPIYGWGGNDGYVYQKAYCEMFVDPKRTEELQKLVAVNPTLNMYAINHSKTKKIIPDEGGVTALTWGVFPNREIVQPTIFDPVTFMDVWADEAFGLWTTMWLNLYEPNTISYELIANIRDEFFLVAIIDNNFMSKNHLWDTLLEAGNNTK